MRENIWALCWEGNDSGPYWSLTLVYRHYRALSNEMKYEAVRMRKERKGVRQGGWGEMPGLDILGHKSLSQHSEVLALRQRENEGEEKERSWKRDIGSDKTNCSKMLSAGMKQPSIIRISVSAHHHPPPLCRHHHHSLYHYPGRCHACGGQTAKECQKCCEGDKRI